MRAVSREHLGCVCGLHHVRLRVQVVEVPASHHGRLWTLAGCRVLHDTGLRGDRELTLSVQLRANGGLVVVPYGSAVGLEAPFVLRTFSSVAIEMTQVLVSRRSRSRAWRRPDFSSRAVQHPDGQKWYCVRARVQSTHLPTPCQEVPETCGTLAGAIASGVSRGWLVEGAPCGRLPASANLAVQPSVPDRSTAARRGDDCACANRRRRRKQRGRPARSAVCDWDGNSGGAHLYDLDSRTSVKFLVTTCNPVGCNRIARKSNRMAPNSSQCMLQLTTAQLEHVCVQPEIGQAGLGRRATAASGADVLAQSTFDTFDEATMLLELLPDKPYLLVPSTLAAGTEGTFEVRCALPALLRTVRAHVPSRCALGC